MTSMPTVTNCTDSATWYRSGEPAKTCDWVRLNPTGRCSTDGADGTTAIESCLHSCASELQDDSTWYRSGNTEKTCDWVDEVPDLRCGKYGQDGTVASEACLATCSTCFVEPTLSAAPVPAPTQCMDDATWFRGSNPAKNCEWVGGYSDKRCQLTNEDGTITGYEACSVTCGTC